MSAAAAAARRLATVAGHAAHRGVGDGLVLREVDEGDYDKGYLALVSQLSAHAGRVPRETFAAQLRAMRASGGVYHTVVVEDTTTRRVVASATLLVERKFIRGCAAAGHVEDVVVSEEARGRRLGALVVNELVRVARERGCYKVILDCSVKNVRFYEKLGFAEHAREMALYLTAKPRS